MLHTVLKQYYKRFKVSALHLIKAQYKQAYSLKYQSNNHKGVLQNENYNTNTNSYKLPNRSIKR
jgi:hypothetical protein